jgi:hypothetical protein
MKLRDRSAFGRGIIDGKTNVPIHECPFTNEMVGSFCKRDMWLRGHGFGSGVDQTFGKLRKQLYEDLE